MPQEGFCRSEGCLFFFFIPSSRGTTSLHPERLQLLAGQIGARCSEARGNQHKAALEIQV